MMSKGKKSYKDEDREEFTLAENLKGYLPNSVNDFKKLEASRIPPKVLQSEANKFNISTVNLMPPPKFEFSTRELPDMPKYQDDSEFEYRGS